MSLYSPTGKDSDQLPANLVDCGFFYVKQKQWKLAQQSFEQASIGGEDISLFRTTLVDIEIKLGNYIAAEKLSRENLLEYPNDAVSYNLLGISLFRQKLRDEAFAVLWQGVKVVKSPFVLLQTLGDFYIAQKEWQKAESVYTQAHALGPLSRNASVRFGLARRSLGMYKEAESILSECLKKNRTHIPCIEQLARTLRGLKRTQDALALLEKTLASDDAQPVLWWALVDICGKSYPDKVSRAFERLETFSDEDKARVLLKRAEAAIANNNWSEACKYFNDSFKLQAPSKGTLRRFADLALENKDYFAIESVSLAGESFEVRLGVHYRTQFYMSRAQEFFSDISSDPVQYYERLCDEYRGKTKPVFLNRAVRLSDVGGEYYNIVDGVRKTDGNPDVWTKTVYVLGSSEAFAVCNEDKHTISSFLQHKFISAGYGSVRVMNCATPATKYYNHFLILQSLSLCEGDAVVMLMPWRPYQYRHVDIRLELLECSSSMGAYCAEKGVRFHVFFSPTPILIENPSPSEKIYIEAASATHKGAGFDADTCELLPRMMAYEFKNAGIPCTPLFSLANRPHDMGEVFFDFQHMNHRLHERVAERIFEELTEKTIISTHALRISDNKIKEKAVNGLRLKARQAYENNPDVVAWLKAVKNPEFDKKETIGAVVMNCNPFTNGHLFLVESALGQVDALYLFVVQEDKSFFPFPDRFDLVKAGVSKLGHNITVVPSGNFIISTLSFPEYFTKERSTAPADPTTDVLIFCSVIAPALNIRVRFVGKEPSCIVTNSYNATMQELLPPLGIDLKIIQRKEARGRAISASTVRQAMRNNNLDLIKELVPESTYAYLVRKNLIGSP